MLGSLGTTAANLWRYGSNTVKTILGVGAVGITGLVTADQTLNNGNSTRNFIQGIFEGIGRPQAGAQRAVQFHSFYAFIDEAARMLQTIFGEGPITSSIRNWAQAGMGVAPEHRRTGLSRNERPDGSNGPDSGSPNGANGQQRAAAPSNFDVASLMTPQAGIGAAALAAATVGGVVGGRAGRSTAAGATASVADDALSVMQQAQTGGVAGSAARATSGWRSVLGRLPVVGKYFGAAALVGAGAMALSGEAEAAPATPAAPSTGGATPPVAPAASPTLSLGPVTLPQEAVAEVGGLGASLALGGAFTRAAAAGGTAIAPAIGLNGLRLVPGIGAAVVGSETVYQVGRDVLKGNFGQAALNGVGAVPEIVGAFFGAPGLAAGALLREGYSALATRATGMEVSGSLTGQGLRATFQFAQDAGIIPAPENTPAAHAEALMQPPTLGEIESTPAPHILPGNQGAFNAAATGTAPAAANDAAPTPAAARPQGLVDRLAARRQAEGISSNGARFIPERAAAAPQMQ
jgi:hypothetical protein